MRYTTFLGILSLALAVSAEQTPFSDSSSSRAKSTKKRPLKGRFIHITDFHPDPHYKAGATFESGCHRKPKKDKGKGRVPGERGGVEVEGGKERERGKDAVAGKWGSGVSDCDSPMSLVNATFDWLKKEWADEVDFVVWTGDNARHDIDRLLPRTPKEIFNSNRMMVDKMRDTFPSDVTIIPSMGNNDIYPHNVLAPGPNSVTSEFLHIWKHFIPSDFGHVFERGAYFSAEVVPDRLGVISLNTLFWYDSNTLVDGCRDRSNDPGALEMDWLEVQLEEFRERGMQVWLTGHVPPHMGHYYDNCYLRYGDLALRYQDTIVGHLFGHMNVDHFFFIDVDELESGTNVHSTSSNTTLSASSPYRISGRSANNGLQDELKKDFGEMPGPQKIKLKDYAVMNVAPSVVPTYLPGVRVYTYNISGVTRDGNDEDHADPNELVRKRKGGQRHDQPKKDCSRPENEDKPHCAFKHKPRYYSKDSPSRKNVPLAPLGYIQFYLPALDLQSVDAPAWEVEYTTHKAQHFIPHTATQPMPVPLHLLPGFDAGLFRDEGDDIDEEITTRREKFRAEMKRITPWGMKDLTIGSYVKLARQLVAERKMWNKFSEIMYVSSDPS